jgi:DinB superfamily
MMDVATNDQLRTQLVELLRNGNAHMPFSEAVADFPDAMINRRPRNVTYTFWHLLEHLRLTQRDILDYVTDPNYEEREWPREYWPAPDAEATPQEWNETISAFWRDLEKLIAIVEDDATDLFATVPSHDEHTILREMLIVADHNAYHIGELAILRQTEAAWGPKHDKDG